MFLVKWDKKKLSSVKEKKKKIAEWHSVDPDLFVCVDVCVDVLQSSQPNEVMSSVVSLPNHTFTGQA